MTTTHPEVTHCWVHPPGGESCEAAEERIISDPSTWLRVWAARPVEDTDDDD